MALTTRGTGYIWCAGVGDKGLSEAEELQKLAGEKWAEARKM
jgi:hypothetical protein